MVRRVEMFVVQVLAVVVALCLGTAALAQTVTITQLMMPHHYELSGDYLNEMARKFEAQHPGVAIEFSTATNRQDYTEKVVVGTAGGVIYDVLLTPALSFAEIAGRGLLADLHPFVERDPDLSLDDFLQIALDGSTMGNQLLGLPLGVSALTPVSNVRMFDEAGMATPGQLGDAWNWSSLREIGAKLSQDRNGNGQNDVFGILINSVFSRITPFFVHNAGGDVFDAHIEPRNSTFSSDPAVQPGIDYYVDLFMSGYVLDAGSPQFLNERAAVNFNYPSEGSRFIEAAGTPFEYEVALAPAGPVRQGNEVLTFAYSLHNFSQHKEISWEWIKFLATDRESVLGVMRAWGNVTPYKPYIAEYLELFPNDPPSARIWVDILQRSDARIRPVTPVYAAVDGEFNRRFRSTVLTGEESVANFLLNMDRFTQAQLDEAYR